MAPEPEIEHCPNCGAPLALDFSGVCHWCNAQITAERVPTSAEQLGFGAAAVAMERHNQLHLCDSDSTLPLPAYPILSCLSLVAYDTAIQNFLDQPGRIEIARAMTAAVTASGERIRDADQNDDVVGRGEKMYTPDEWWMCDLSVDFLAMLGNVIDVRKDMRASARETVKLHDDLWYRRTRKPIKKAGDGPEGFRALRAAVPYRPSGKHD